MRIDLHTHSSASDGTDTPADLVRAAKAAGLDVVALTDHDAMSGWAEAARAAEEVGITLVPGLEISTTFHHRGVHLLAYLPDPTDPRAGGGARQDPGGRTARTPAMVERAARARHRRSPRTTYAVSPAGPSPRAVRTSPTPWSAWASPPTATRRSPTLLDAGGPATSTAMPCRSRR